MGLSSSQGRLLMLTSRLSDIELQQMIISQRQNQLAWKEADAAKEYNESMNNYKLVMKVKNEEGKAEDKDLTFNILSSMGYLITNAKGELYLERKIITREEKIAQLEELRDNAESIGDDDSVAEIEEQINNLPEDYREEGDWIPPEGVEITFSEDKTMAYIGEKTFVLQNGNDFLKDKNKLQSLLINNVLYIKNTKDISEKATTIGEVLEANTDFEYVLDTSDDAAAESKHNYEMALLSAKENQLEMDLAQLETQHEAVLKEYESVKELISSNVDRTFKLFSNG